MKRLVTVIIGIVLFAGTVAAATAAEGSWGPWEPTYQGPISVPAGVVCSFPVQADPVRQDLALRYHYDEAGNPDGYQVKGVLIGRITNLDTGASVERNLSGFGTVLYNPDGSWEAVVTGPFLVFFVTGDNPSSQLLLFSGRTVLRGDPTGSKTLVSQSGATEDLCATLS
jgi:hypothetical protein